METSLPVNILKTTEKFKLAFLEENQLAGSRLVGVLSARWHHHRTSPFSMKIARVAIIADIFTMD